MALFTMGVGYEHFVVLQLSCCIVVWGGAGRSTEDAGGSTGRFTCLVCGFGGMLLAVFRSCSARGLRVSGE